MIERFVTDLPGIGSRLTAGYERLGINTIRDLLFAFPYRYDDFRHVEGAGTVQPGMQATVKGTVTSVRSRRSYRRKMMLTEATIQDDTGTITAVWFHQPYMAKQLKVGMHISASGKVDDAYGLSLVNPQFEILKPGVLPTHTGRLVPVYSLSGRMAQKGRRNAIRAAFQFLNEVEEWIPELIRATYQVASINEAIPEIHFPTDPTKWEKAMHRLKFGELLLHQIAHVQARRTIEQIPGRPIPMNTKCIRDCIDRLPFQLTKAQRKAIFHAVQDMESGSPMHRLLEGDVGSGKTVVAGVVAANVCVARKQTAYLAPTEILAVQQAHALKDILGDKTSVGLLTSSQQELDGTAARRKDVLDAVLDGRVGVLVGTHALLSHDISIPTLALVIVDEQHRFGVEQRRLLLEPSRDGSVPHLLSMTATPIPRTLALTLYGDMQVSVLDELPPGRGSIETILLEPKQDFLAFGLIAERLRAGAQAYMVCPFIEDSETSDADSVQKLYDRIKSGPLSDWPIELLHGKMKPQDKKNVMRRFQDGDVRVLIATTVIEVGVNVPEATVIFIEGAERFGLAQLHQLRGRVRRSNKPAVCFLHPSALSHATKQRLDALVKFDDGFKLAEIDLRLRGSGDRFGTKQHGLQEFRYADLSDQALIAQARTAAEQLLQDGGLNTFPVLQKQLEHYIGSASYA